MDAYRLKNITILILVILNLFLLGIWGRHLWQDRSSQRRMEQELRQFCSDQGLHLAEDIDLVPPPHASLSLNRSLEAEAQMAAFILEEEVAAQDEGGGIYSYTGRLGTVRFRSNGTFSYTPRNHPVSSSEAMSNSFCDTFGYDITLRNHSEQEEILTATQIADGKSVYNSFVTFLFTDGKLTSLSGTYISPTDSTILRENTVTRTTALVRILDYLLPSGMIFSELVSIHPVYELQSTAASPLQLAAKWEITTDTGRFYVDCSTGAITRG